MRENSNSQNVKPLTSGHLYEKLYTFKPIRRPILTKHTIMKILKQVAGNVSVFALKVSLDLGLSISSIKVEGDVIIFPQNEQINLNRLSSCIDDIDDDDVLTIVHNDLRKIAFSVGRNYYKLKAVGPHTAPTLEINGIHMHRIVGITPWEDSLLKVKYARVKRGMSVLDICTGLGYTAITSLLRGAREVITIEIDECVLKIASYNPWSWRLANDKIKIILGDATEVVNDLESSSFDRVIHDPPTIAIAGELYSKEFYKELFRVLKKGGILFHYTGKPGHSRGVNISKGVANRLRQVGFQVKVVKSACGIVAFKPRLR